MFFKLIITIFFYKHNLQFFSYNTVSWYYFYNFPFDFCADIIFFVSFCIWYGCIECIFFGILYLYLFFLRLSIFFVCVNFVIYSSFVYYDIRNTFIVKSAIFLISAATFNGVTFLNVIVIIVAIVIGFIKYFSYAYFLHVVHTAVTNFDCVLLDRFWFVVFK